MKMEVAVKVLTLNCWNIPGISKNRKERIDAIATEFAKGLYDFVVLQEVWNVDDYSLIVNRVTDVLPYSHYFHSGLIGAGLCIFSKGEIVDIHFERWCLNGYIHKIQHGDWFGGKGVGLCKVIYKGLKVNIYTAHLHAEYNRAHDEYLTHRICQAFEFSQFIKLTGDMSDLNIVAGDFNTEPGDVPYKLLRYNSSLRDSFKESKGDECIGGTNEHPRNTYTQQKTLAKYPNGKRIDYVLYNSSKGTLITSLSCETPLDKCPGMNFSYSDHEAVLATLLITKSNAAKHIECNEKEQLERNKRIEVLENVLQQLTKAIAKLQWDRIIYFVFTTIFLCLILGTHNLQLPYYGLQILMTLLHFILTILLAYTIFMSAVSIRIEEKSVLSVRATVEVLLKNLRVQEEINLVNPSSNVAGEGDRLI